MSGIAFFNHNIAAMKLEKAKEREQSACRDRVSKLEAAIQALIFRDPIVESILRSNMPDEIEATITLSLGEMRRALAVLDEDA